MLLEQGATLRPAHGGNGQGQQRGRRGGYSSWFTEGGTTIQSSAYTPAAHQITVRILHVDKAAVKDSGQRHQISFRTMASVSEPREGREPGSQKVEGNAQGQGNKKNRVHDHQLKPFPNLYLHRLAPTSQCLSVPLCKPAVVVRIRDSNNCQRTSGVSRCSP